MRTGIKIVKDEVNSFGDQDRTYQLVNLESGQVLAEHNILNLEGEHRPSIEDLFEATSILKSIPVLVKGAANE